MTAMTQRAPVLEPSLDDVILAFKREGSLSVTEKTYVRLALDDPQTKWELHDGLLVEKPGMNFTHLDVVDSLDHQLSQQLDFRQFRVLVNDGRLRRTSRNYLIPDVSVVPSDLIRHRRQEQPKGLGVFDEPMLFVAEVWSPSTGRYDVNTKIPTYKLRGDLEIWRLHPFERTVTIWRRQPDGSYDETVHQGGLVQVTSLPGVTIDLDALFDGE
jgi:Uma2 family endonuclease